MPILKDTGETFQVGGAILHLRWWKQYNKEILVRENLEEGIKKEEKFTLIENDSAVVIASELGAPGGMRWWKKDKVVDSLGNERDVLCYNPRGSGLSSGSFTIDNMVEDLSSIISRVKKEYDHVIGMGIGLGAYAMARLLGDSPVDAAILVTPESNVTETIPAPIKSGVDKGKLPLLSRIRLTFENFQGNKTFYHQQFNGNQPNMFSEVLCYLHQRIPVQQVQAFFKSIRDSPQIEDSFSCPTLVVGYETEPWESLGAETMDTTPTKKNLFDYWRKSKLAAKQSPSMFGGKKILNMHIEDPSGITQKILEYAHKHLYNPEPALADAIHSE